MVIVDTHSKPSAARVIVDRLREITAEAGALRRQHPLPLGPLARQRGLPRGVPGRGDRHQPAHPRGDGQEGPQAHPGPRAPGARRDRPAPRRARRRHRRRGAREAPGRSAPRRVVSRRGPGAQAGAAHHGLRADDEALPARPRDPAPAISAGPTPRATSSSTCRRRRWSSPATRSSAGRRSWATATRRTGSTTLDRLAELDFTHIIMGHGEPAGRDWLRTFRGYIHDMVEAVREEAATGATPGRGQAARDRAPGADLREARSPPTALPPMAPGPAGQHRAHLSRW